MKKTRIKATQLTTKALLQSLQNASGTTKSNIQKELQKRGAVVNAG